MQNESQAGINKILKIWARLYNNKNLYICTLQKQRGIWRYEDTPFKKNDYITVEGEGVVGVHKSSKDYRQINKNRQGERCYDRAYFTQE